MNFELAPIRRPQMVDSEGVHLLKMSTEVDDTIDAHSSNVQLTNPEKSGILYIPFGCKNLHNMKKKLKKM